MNSDPYDTEIFGLTTETEIQTESFCLSKFLLTDKRPEGVYVG